MVEVFNSLNVKVACLGNHDLDFGIARACELIAKTKPCNWLMSNLNVLGKPVCGLDTFDVREFPLAQSPNNQKIKIGFFGLASEDWPDTMISSFTEELEYTDNV